MDINAENEGQYEDCGVNEEMFPCMGKCCSKSDATLMIFYERTCPCCGISASLPDGATLKIATIFECLLCGYGKRISE